MRKEGDKARTYARRKLNGRLRAAGLKVEHAHRRPSARAPPASPPAARYARASRSRPPCSAISHPLSEHSSVCSRAVLARGRPAGHLELSGSSRASTSSRASARPHDAREARPSDSSEPVRRVQAQSGAAVQAAAEQWARAWRPVASSQRARASRRVAPGPRAARGGRAAAASLHRRCADAGRCWWWRWRGGWRGRCIPAWAGGLGKDGAHGPAREQLRGRPGTAWS